MYLSGTATNTRLGIGGDQAKTLNAGRRAEEGRLGQVGEHDRAGIGRSWHSQAQWSGMSWACTRMATSGAIGPLPGMRRAEPALARSFVTKSFGESFWARRRAHVSAIRSKSPRARIAAKTAWGRLVDVGAVRRATTTRTVQPVQSDC